MEFVFHRNEKPMEQNYIRRVFKRVLGKAGLREIRFHDIRHTFASLLLSDGASPVYVKEAGETRLRIRGAALHKMTRLFITCSFDQISVWLRMPLMNDR